MSKHNLFKSAAIIMILTILSKILGFGRESLIAAKYGTSFSSDIYVFSYGITQMLFASIGASIGTTFIPMLSDYIANKTYKERNYFVNNILTITFGIALILSIIGIVFGKYIVLLFAPGFATKYSYENFTQAIFITRIMFISLLFISIQNVLTGVLQAHNEFLILASIGIFYNIIIIIYLIFWGNKFGSFGLSISLVIAFFVQAVVHIPKYKSLGYKYYFVFNLKDEGIKKIIPLIIPVLIGTSISQANFLVDRIFASNVGEGAMSTLNFANKLNLFIYGVFGIAITTVIYPALSNFSAREDNENYNRMLIQSINIINLIMVPATIGMIVLREPLIDIVFKHGVFDDKAAKLTASVLLFYSPSMILYGIRDILNKGFYSIKNTKTPMINGAIGVLINIILNIILVKKMGVTGLALATTIAAFITTLLIMNSLFKIVKLNIYNIFITFCKILVSSIMMGCIIVLIYNNLFIKNSFGIKLGVLLLLTLIGSLIYILFIKIFKISEYEFIMCKIKNKINIRLYGKINS